MKPSKKLISQAEADGSLYRLNLLLSAAQILICEANNLIEEGADLMLERGLLIGSIKQRHKNFAGSADAFFKEFIKYITEDESKMNMFKDLESFDVSFRKWAKIESDWEPKTETA